MKRTAAVMLLIILLAAGCADAEAEKPILDMAPVAEAAAPLRICAARIVADAYWRISEAVGNFSEGSPAADFSEAARQA